MSSSRQVLPYCIAALSGSCALVYEVVWTRVFTPVFGLSVYATTAVLCAFMVGLGIGSTAAPALIRRWGRSLWGLYALLELGIGLGALMIPLSVGPITSAYLALAAADGPVALTSLVRFLLAVTAMALPTILMGLTLPVLVHACRSLAAEDRIASRRVGLLYGINTVGGAAGCLLVGFVLIQQLGVFATSAVAAATNFALAALVYALLGREQSVVSPELPAADQLISSASAARAPMKRQWILLLYGLIGFVALGYELCWFRILVFYLQSATYSFSLMLTLFLLGVGSGSAFFSAYLEKKLDSAGLDFQMVLGSVLLLLATIGAGTLHVYGWIPGVWGWLIDIVGASSWLVIVAQKAAVAALVILPATFLFGISFPLVARLYKAHQVEDSTTVGFLYGANTVGAVLGSLLTGFVMFDWVGVQNTLTFLSLLCAAIGLAACVGPMRASNRARIVTAVLAMTTLATLFWTPPRMLIANFERHNGKVLFYQETAADVCFVHEAGKARVLAFGDGRGTAGTGPYGNYANRLLAYSAMLLRPEARDVLVISMGAGNTASAFAQFPIERLDIVDISSGPFEAARYFHTNLGVLEDPRVHTHVEDGRNFLLRSQRKYDVIQLELPTLHTAGVVYLYTREFYEIARARLKEGGVLSQWIDVVQTERPISYQLINTMRTEFPHSLVWTDNWSWWITGLAQPEPASIDYAKARALFSHPRVQRDLKSVRSSLEDTLSKLRSAGPELEAAVGDADWITDDKTVADFQVPKGESPVAFGGGVAYYTSPLAETFRSRWKQDKAAPVKFRKPRFYTEAPYAVRADRSLMHVAGDVPEDVLDRVRKLRRDPRLNSRK